MQSGYFSPFQLRDYVDKVKSTLNPIVIRHAFAIPHESLAITKMDEQSTSAHKSNTVEGTSQVCRLKLYAATS